MQFLYIQCGFGYIEQDEQYKQFLDRISELGIDIKYLHTSGHFDSYTFKEIISITNPKIAAIPIHTEYGERLKEYTDKAVILQDNEILDINERGEFKIVSNDIDVIYNFNLTTFIYTKFRKILKYYYFKIT